MFFLAVFASWHIPFMPLHIDAALRHFHSFAFKQFSLQRGIRFANEQFPAGAQNSMPRDSSSCGTSSHRMTSSSGSTTQPDGFGNGPIG
jgi:hypothetical protein